MPIWSVGILAVIFLGGGIASLCAGKITGKGVWKLVGVALLLICAVGILYFGAAILLLGGIE